MAKHPRLSRTQSRTRHQIGAGPGNIAIHAVSRRSGAVGPVAVCGHPLRGARSGLGRKFQGDEVFEEIAESHPDVCEECADILGVDIREEAAAPEDDQSGWMSFNRVSGTVAIGTLVGLMAGARLAMFLLR